VVVDEDLLERLERLSTKPFEGEVYRQTFGSTPPERANTRGARWNPPDVAALYTSLDRDTVIAEGEHILSSQPVRPRVRQEMHRIRIRLQKVLDLRSPVLLAGLGVDGETLRSDDHWACRKVGEAVSHLGYDAILVPSARSAGANLVIYATNARDGDFEVIESELIEDPDR
jgi:RES domain-containing protein